jgi:enamine deaminase RidA (YjgF/YER057c/UK114 family)
MTGSARRRVFSGSPFEARVGICRAVRAGNHIAVTGTAPLGPDGKTVAPGDAAAQARRSLEIIRDALVGLGAELRHVVRSRVLLTRIEDWPAVARVHAEFLSEARPANTVMQVSRFIDPEWLIEIEVDAIVDD